MPTVYDVTSNYHWRNFLYRDEVPENILHDELDWTDEETEYDGFFEYRGSWYHLSEFMRDIDIPHIDGGYWDGFKGDSYFSGVAIKLSKDGEQYQIATIIARSMYIDEIADAIIKGEMTYEQFPPSVQVDIDVALEKRMH